MLLISEPVNELDPYAQLLQREGHHVDRAQNGIEANDLILTGLAVSSPYELIVLHHSQNKSDTRELITYWRNQDPFLPLVLISQPQTLTDGDLRLLGLIDCIPEDTPIQFAKQRLDLLQQTVALGATFRLKADILERPAHSSDPLAAIDVALNQIQDRLTVRAIAFISYTAIVNDPIVQMGKNLEAMDQIWLDDLCDEAWQRIEPILKKQRMVFETAESPRYMFPISTSRGWEGLLVFFAPEVGDESMDPVLAGQYTTIADGIKFMLEHTRTHEALQRAKKSKSEYMSILSERIRQPMANLQGTSELLMMIDSDPTIKELTSRMAHNAKMATDMLEDVIELGRIDDGMLVIHPEKIAIPSFLRKTVRQLDILFSEKNLRVAFEMTEQSDLATVGDPQKLARVFSNLLTNAARFSPEGSCITIKIQTEEDDWIRVSVSDQGPGLVPGQETSIFERPVQSSHTSITEQGIGLYLCRKFVTAHDGRIWVESEPGFGCAFHVRLPPANPKWDGMEQKR